MFHYDTLNFCMKHNNIAILNKIKYNNNNFHTKKKSFLNYHES